MIARELLDRGLINRVGVLCAPHLTPWSALYMAGTGGCQNPL